MIGFEFYWYVKRPWRINALTLQIFLLLSSLAFYPSPMWAPFVILLAAIVCGFVHFNLMYSHAHWQAFGTKDFDDMTWLADRT